MSLSLTIEKDLKVCYAENPNHPDDVYIHTSSGYVVWNVKKSGDLYLKAFGKQLCITGNSGNTARTITTLINEFFILMRKITEETKFYVAGSLLYTLKKKGVKSEVNDIEIKVHRCGYDDEENNRLAKKLCDKLNREPILP